MSEFQPHLEILPDAQRRLWSELSTVPAEFTLYRGTAFALHLGSQNWEIRCSGTGLTAKEDLSTDEHEFWR